MLPQSLFLYTVNEVVRIITTAISKVKGVKRREALTFSIGNKEPALPGAC